MAHANAATDHSVLLGSVLLAVVCSRASCAPAANGEPANSLPPRIARPSAGSSPVVDALNDALLRLHALLSQQGRGTLAAPLHATLGPRPQGNSAYLCVVTRAPAAHGAQLRPIRLRCRPGCTLWSLTRSAAAWRLLAQQSHLGSAAFGELQRLNALMGASTGMTPWRQSWGNACANNQREERVGGLPRGAPAS